MLVKICGLTDLSDARAALQAGADLLGFVFAPSPRRVEPSRVAAILHALRQEGGAAGWRAVGVFVDEDPRLVSRAALEAGLDLIQLHGAEGPDYCRDLPLPVIKAVRVRDPGSLAGLESYRGAVAHLLLDAWHPAAAGGTGRTFDWGLARAAHFPDIPWLLAGGLTPDNVPQAVAAARPHGVDVSGGVERAPGLKDHQLIRRFILAARGGVPEAGPDPTRERS
jgi:phosphoribosylanthranilate isomerase